MSDDIESRVIRKMMLDPDKPKTIDEGIRKAIRLTIEELKVKGTGILLAFLFLLLWILMLFKVLPDVARGFG